ncbi:MAG: hypothetical protein KGJ53_14830 [Alphaproteobacteria bacterium]|nr:hypothetical protein [Alphaproteobacteria bacterium]MDE2164434.1 hypothetical protein [Alphaproteobacteria bacterium]
MTVIARSKEICEHADDALGHAAAKIGEDRGKLAKGLFSQNIPPIVHAFT